jgi:hypothetical protein
MYWLRMKWHEYWWMHYYRIYAKLRETEWAVTILNRKMNHHWELCACYEEYLKVRRKKNVI